MKKFLFILFISIAWLNVAAQTDDMYFTPSKKAKTETAAQPTEAQYAGSDRDVDEYNRRGKYWSHYQKIGSDEKGNDIIQFSQGNGVYPDSLVLDTTYVVNPMQDTSETEYVYSRRLSRFDDFYGPWGYYSWGYYPWYDSYYYPWSYPWYYRSWYGNPYYYSYYSPWGYYGWYGYPYYGWYGYPYYGYYSYRPARPAHYTYNTWGKTSDPAYRTGQFGGRSNNNRTTRPARPTYNQNQQQNRSIWGGQSTSRSTYTPSHSNSGSFGGSRGGGFGGGGHVSGSGRFGGRR